MAIDNYRHYTEVTYGGKQLMRRYSLSDVATWQIKGEDPNCDLGGPHHQPDLGLYHGSLEQAVKYAVQLPKFWTWGGGGSIDKTNIVTEAEQVANFTKKGAALAKLTPEEIILLGLEDQV